MAYVTWSFHGARMQWNSLGLTTVSGGWKETNPTIREPYLFPSSGISSTGTVIETCALFVFQSPDTADIRRVFYCNEGPTAQFIIKRYIYIHIYITYGICSSKDSYSGKVWWSWLMNHCIVAGWIQCLFFTSHNLRNYKLCSRPLIAVKFSPDVSSVTWLKDE